MGFARHAVQGEGQLTLADSAGQVGAFQGQLRGVTKRNLKIFPGFFSSAFYIWKVVFSSITYRKSAKIRLRPAKLRRAHRELLHDVRESIPFFTSLVIDIYA